MSGLFWYIYGLFLLYIGCFAVKNRILMTYPDDDILELVWMRSGSIVKDTFMSASGEQVRVIARGERDGEGIMSGAEVEISGVLERGDVIVGSADTVQALKYAVLQVCGAPCEPLLRLDGRAVPQLVMEVPAGVRGSVDSLRSGAGNYECGLWLADVPPVERVSLMDELLLERLQRKCTDIMNVFRDSDSNWEQAFHVMLFRAMGGNRNRAPYMKLASRATSTMVSREKSSVEMLEALLLGTSGLLEGCYYDDYIHALRGHFDYLHSKFGIEPMRAAEWEFSRMYPGGNPVIRIVQLASFLSRRDFLFDTLVNCRTRDDVQRFFSAEASPYWTTHYVPDGSSARCPKRIGEEKADLLGINLVVPVMFAYGEYTGKENLKEAALELLESIPAENNVIVRGWTGKGVPVASALDSQAVIQLRNEYCVPGNCTKCRIGRKIIRIDS